MNGTQVADNRADTRRRNSINEHGMKIADAAHRSVGVSISNPRQVSTRVPQYALAVSRIFTRATNQKLMPEKDPDHVLSTAHLWRSLSRDRRFQQVPISEAAPGDIVIATHPSNADGYAGIIVDHGKVVSNSTEGVRDDSSLQEIQRGQPGMAAFRYVGVWNMSRNEAIANAGFDPNEARVPAGQPGGGQWTTGMAPSRIALSGGDSRISSQPIPDDSTSVKGSSEQVRQILQSLGLPQDKVDSIAKSIDAAGSNSKFIKAFRAAVKNAHDYSQSVWTELLHGDSEAGFTVGADGTISPITYTPGGALGTSRPEPANTVLGVHSHYYNDPGYGDGPDTMGSGDIGWADSHNRPETAIGANDLTTYDPTTGKAKTMPLPSWCR